MRTTICLSVLLATLIAAAPAAAAVGEGVNVTALSHLGHGPFQAVAAVGDTVYAGCGSVLQVIAFDDPAQPLVIGELDLFCNIQDVAVLDELLYVGLQEGGLVVLDAGDPATLAVTGHLLPTSSFNGLQLVGSLLYAGCDSYLRIYDVSVPSSPVELGSHGHTAGVLDVAVDGGTAYVACGYGGCQTVDVNDPANPAALGTWDDGYYTYGVVADPGRNHVYTCDFSDGLHVLDVSDPAVPTPVAAWDPGGNMRRGVLDGTLLLLACDGSGLEVVDITVPSAPIPVGSLDTARGAQNVALGRYVYLADDELGLLAVDLSIPASPAVAGDLVAPGQARGLALGLGRAFVAGYQGAWHVIDISDPAAPHQTRLLNGTMRTAERMLFQDDRLYVGDGFDGLFIYDVTVPDDPQLLGRYDPPAYTRGVAVSGDYAFLTSGAIGLVIADISNPAAPQHVATVPLADFAWDVKVQGDYAYVADFAGGLRIIDVSDPVLAAEIGFYDTNIRATALQVEGNLVYVVDSLVGLQIFDVATPASPVLIKTASASYPYGLVKQDQYLYVADGYAGLRVFDVTDPLAPVQVGSFYTGTTCYGVAAEGRRIYLTSSLTGFWILENDLMVPNFLAAFAARRDRGAAVLDWTLTEEAAVAFHVWRQEPDRERIRVSEEPLSGGRRFSFRDPAPPAGESDYWLQVLGGPGGEQWYGPARLAAATVPRLSYGLGPAWPNPANPAVSFSFTLAEAGRATVLIHDLQGRLVTTLVDGLVAAGEHPVHWDGRDAAGREVASGTYLVRLQTAAGTATRKLLLAR
jgi:hypothetical protein